MRKLTRVSIAISELTGGALLMIGPVFASRTHVQLTAWYLVLIEFVGVIALTAGYRLVQDRSGGFALSLFLQALQLIQLFLPNFLYRVVLGPYLVVILSPGAGLIIPGFKGELTVGWKGPTFAAIGANAVAAILFFLLARAILEQRRRVPTSEELGSPIAVAC